MALVLTRIAGESIRVTDTTLNKKFEIKFLEIRETGVFAELKSTGLKAEVHVPFGEEQKMFDGKLSFHKGHRGRDQVRCVFDMPEHVNILRTELGK